MKENNNHKDLDAVVIQTIQKGRKTIRQHFYDIVKVLVILCILTLTVSKVFEYYSDNKIERLTNEIQKKEHKLDSIQSNIELSKVEHERLNTLILESERKQQIYKIKTDELYKEYINIRKRVKDMGTDSAYDNVRQYLDSIRTRNKEEK